MTAAQAIREECRRCSGMSPGNCWTKVCSLSPNVLEIRSSVKRIALHCRDCQGEDHPKECTGELLDGGTCPLHPYRLGRNPFRPKRAIRAGLGKQGAEALKKYRRGLTTGRSFPGPEATISPLPYPEVGS